MVYRSNRISLRVSDQATLFAVRNLDLTPAQVQPPAPTFGGTIESLLLKLPPAGAQVCGKQRYAAPCPVGASKTLALTVDVKVAANADNPLSEVYAYRVDDTGLPRYMTLLTDVATVDTAGARIFRFTGTWRPRNVPVQSNAIISAVRIAATGGALKTQDVTVNIIQGR